MQFALQMYIIKILYNMQCITLKIVPKNILAIESIENRYRDRFFWVKN